MKPDVVPSSRPFWWGGFASFCAALFFFLSCLLNLAYLSGTAFEVKSPFQERTPGTFEKWTALDVQLLRDLWAYRAISSELNIAASALITLSFFLLLAAVMALADAFEVHGGNASHKASKVLLVPCFVFAAALAVLELTFNAGAVTTSAWMYKSWKLDDEQVKTLELSYVLTQSRGTWLLGMLWFFFGIGLSAALYLNARHRMLYRSWNVLTAMIVLLCFVGFLSDVARLRWWVVSQAIDLSLTVLVWFLFMPIWLVWIGVYLISQQAEFTPVPMTGPPRDTGAISGNGARAPYRDEEAEMSRL